MTGDPGSSTLARGRFRVLLGSLLLFFVGTAAATGTAYESAIYAALQGLVIVAAIWDLSDAGGGRQVAVALAASAIVLSFLDLSTRFRHLPVAASSSVALLAGFIVWRAYSSVMRPNKPAGDRIVGAICVYLLIGLAWAKMYETLDTVVPGSFRFPPADVWSAPKLLRYTYVSFITLSTVGYGDVTPVTALAGTLAWLEAVTGQLYLATTLARLVALSLAERGRPKGA